METIVGEVGAFSRDLHNTILTYRYKIFIEQLGWQLPVQHGLECDQFDRPDTLYVVAFDDRRAICGHARLLPTTRPYLLSEAFPQLMNGAAIPASPDVWELSRFAVGTPDTTYPKLRRTMANASGKVLGAAVRCAALRGAKRLITVSPLGIERLLYRMGVHAHRAGPLVMIDGEPVFACWIEIDSVTIHALNITIEPGTRSCLLPGATPITTVVPAPFCSASADRAATWP